MSEVEDILQEANRLVTLDRGSAYGHPFDDFTRTGKMWAAILGLDEVRPEQVAMCMIALKLSRECNKPGHDNRVDMAGYVKTLDMVVEKRAEWRVPPYKDLVEVPKRTGSGVPATPGNRSLLSILVDNDVPVGEVPF